MAWGGGGGITTKMVICTKNYLLQDSPKGALLVHCFELFVVVCHCFEFIEKINIIPIFCLCLF